MQGLKPIATVRNYRELHAVLRARSEEMHITREASDLASRHTGKGVLSNGYSSKLLAPLPIRKLGITSLGALLGVLKLKLIVVEDAD